MSRPINRPGAKSAAGGVVLKAGARVSEHRLRNGLRVLIAERHSDPIVAVMLFYGVGSRNEREEEAGVSHFLEHMMFKGTRRIGKGEVDRITTLLGGSNNAYTSNDHTGYWFELASDRWETALEIEADRMRNLALDADEFDAERSVVLEELSMSEDDPWRVLARRVQAALFPHHPYGRPIIGFTQTLEHMDVAAMRDYYRRFYHPGNATLVVCGDVKRGPALARVRKAFGKIPAGPPREQADSFRLEPAEPAGEQRLAVTWDDPARRLCMAWPTVPVAHEDDWALDLIVSILVSGRMSRLQRRLVLDGGLAVSVSASNDARVDSGVFWLFAQCAQDVEPQALEAAIDEELARLRDETVPAAELKRAKAVIAAGEAFESEGISDVAEELGSCAVDADWRMALDGGARHARVTAKQVRDCAARWLRDDRRVVGWSLPRAAGPGSRGKRAKRSGRRA